MGELKENKSLEKEFIESLKRNTFNIQCGCRFSGKTTWMQALLYHLVTEDNFYKEFHLVLPTYDTGQTGSTFDWIGRLPKSKKDKITIYCDFSLIIVDRLIEESDGKTNRLLYIDDATAEQELFSQSDIMRSLSTKARHYKITTFVCLHFMKLRNTLMRNSAEFLILHRMTDYKVLENIYTESASLFWDKNEFMAICRQEMEKEYPCVIIWRDKGRIDVGHGMDYSFEKKHRDYVLNKNIKRSDVKVKKDTIQTKQCKTSATPRGPGESEVSEDEGQQTAVRSRRIKLIQNKKSKPPLVRF
jgi:hypothetical protein